MIRVLRDGAPLWRHADRVFRVDEAPPSGVAGDGDFCHRPCTDGAFEFTGLSGRRWSSM